MYSTLLSLLSGDISDIMVVSVIGIGGDIVVGEAALRAIDDAAAAAAAAVAEESRP